MMLTKPHGFSLSAPNLHPRNIFQNILRGEKLTTFDVSHDTLNYDDDVTHPG